MPWNLELSRTTSSITPALDYREDGSVAPPTSPIRKLSGLSRQLRALRGLCNLRYGLT